MGRYGGDMYRGPLFLFCFLREIGVKVTIWEYRVGRDIGVWGERMQSDIFGGGGSGRTDVQRNEWGSLSLTDLLEDDDQEFEMPPVSVFYQCLYTGSFNWKIMAV